MQESGIGRVCWLPRNKKEIKILSRILDSAISDYLQEKELLNVWSDRKMVEKRLIKNPLTSAISVLADHKIKQDDGRFEKIESNRKLAAQKDNERGIIFDEIIFFKNKNKEMEFTKKELKKKDKRLALGKIPEVCDEAEKNLKLNKLFSAYLRKYTNQAYLTGLYAHLAQPILTRYFGYKYLCFSTAYQNVSLDVFIKDVNHIQLKIKCSNPKDMEQKAFYNNELFFVLDLKIPIDKLQPDVSDINVTLEDFKFDVKNKEGKQLLSKVIDFEKAVLNSESKKELVQKGFKDNDLQLLLLNLFYSEELVLEKMAEEAGSDFYKDFFVFLYAMKNDLVGTEDVYVNAFGKLVNDNVLIDDLLKIPDIDSKQNIFMAILKCADEYLKKYPHSFNEPKVVQVFEKIFSGQKPLVNIQDINTYALCSSVSELNGFQRVLTNVFKNKNAGKFDAPVFIDPTLKFYKAGFLKLCDNLEEDAVAGWGKPTTFDGTVFCAEPQSDEKNIDILKDSIQSSVLNERLQKYLTSGLLNKKSTLFLELQENLYLFSDKHKGTEEEPLFSIKSDLAIVNIGKNSFDVEIFIKMQDRLDTQSEPVHEKIVLSVTDYTADDNEGKDLGKIIVSVKTHAITGKEANNYKGFLNDKLQEGIVEKGFRAQNKTDAANILVTSKTASLEQKISIVEYFFSTGNKKVAKEILYYLINNQESNKKLMTLPIQGKFKAMLSEEVTRKPSVFSSKKIKDQYSFCLKLLKKGLVKKTPKKSRVPEIESDTKIKKDNFSKDDQTEIKKFAQDNDFSVDKASSNEIKITKTDKSYNYVCEPNKIKLELSEAGKPDYSEMIKIALDIQHLKEPLKFNHPNKEEQGKMEAAYREYKVSKDAGRENKNSFN